ncbi:hypothetical protein GS4_23_01180 [Gordonia soli NBRC 108243]|uniref:Uncharacterized protein n=1 Tax=Gordonia soli NBRC 108243 TaxID=1223545 RepID=M0QLZ6_9ACTN|nr:hypothetical protein GS4_23_01180 [Gordonia soli NBRC 108243]
MVLTGVRDADAYMRSKGWGLLILSGVGIYFITMIVIGVATMNGYIGYAGAAVCTAIALPIIYVRKRNTLRARFTGQTLVLSREGLVRADDCIRVEMRWDRIHTIRDQNSAVSTGGVGMAGMLTAAAANATKRDVSLAIIGEGMISPVPGAPSGFLRQHDRRTGSRLLDGQSSVTPNAVIFPAEYEAVWTNGVVGAWLRYHRPDLLR